MASQRTGQEDDVPARQVNNILRNLRFGRPSVLQWPTHLTELSVHRGEHFRHARNALGKPAPVGSLSSYAHNQPTLPLNLIYPTQVPETSHTWIPGPSPPRSWRFLLSSSSLLTDTDQVNTDTPAWRERALSLIFSPNVPSSLGDARSRPIYPDPSPVPQLTVLCLQCLRLTCPGADIADIVPFIPPHLRRTLVRYTAIHAPLTQIELDALCGGTTMSTQSSSSALRRNHTLVDDRSSLDHEDEDEGTADDSGSWDAVHAQDSEPPALRSLAVLSSPLSAATMLAFPPTLTHLALINIPHRIPLTRLPMICPLVVLLDLSYNAWLQTTGIKWPWMLEEIEWNKWQRLEVLGLRACPVTPKLLRELNRGRWEDVKIIQ